MVIIRERYISDSKYFDLIESQTGKSIRWKPNQDCDDAAIDLSLALMAKNLHDQCRSQAPHLFFTDAQSQLSQSTGNLTVSQYISERFLPRRIIDVSSLTQHSWDTFLKLRIIPRLGNYRMVEITPQILTDFFIGMKKEGLAYGTIDQYYILVKQIFKMAHKTDGLWCNPMDHVDRPKKNKNLPPKKAKAYTPDNMAMIEKALSKESLKWRTFILLVADTGIRRGEACAIRSSVIDRNNNRILINSNLCYTPHTGLRIQTTKTGKERWVYISPYVLSLIQELELQNVKSGKISDYIFIGRNGYDPINPSTASSALRRIGFRNDIENLGTHRLRHTFASIAITNGADVASVAKLLGHADSSMTLQNYTEANPESLQRASQVRRDAVNAVKNK